MVAVGGEEFKWPQPAHHQLWSQQRSYFSPHSTAKTNKKSTFLRKMVSSSISDVVIASVYSEKTRLKNLMMMTMIIIMNKKLQCLAGHRNVSVMFCASKCLCSVDPLESGEVTS